jgi:hypothetical protein
MGASAALVTRKKNPASLIQSRGMESLLRPAAIKETNGTQPSVTDAMRKERADPGIGHDFSKIRISTAPPRIAKTRLMIGKPGDRFEQEADSVADLVMRLPVEGSGQATFPNKSNWLALLRQALDEFPGNESGDAGQTEETAKAEVDREGAEGRPEHVATILLEADNLEEVGAGEQQYGNTSTNPGSSPADTRDEGAVQARELPGQTTSVASRKAMRIDALRVGGQSLSPSSRAFFEPRFGHDFSHVRVHTGPQAGQLARAVRAKAFTAGCDIVFGEGHYQPTSPAGQWLMAHELTHVLQQRERSSCSPARGIQVQRTGQLQIQGGFWKKLWGGIKKGASALWGGIKWAADKVWGGLKAAGQWGWNVLKSGAALAWRQIVNFPERVWRLIKHLGSGIAGVGSWLWEGLKLAWRLDFKGLGKWLLNGVLSGAAWVGRLIGKLVDTVGLGEVWDFVSQIIKMNTRTLTSGEMREAQKTFKNSISYRQVRVDESSLIAEIGAAFKKAGGMGVTTFHTVNFNKKITATAGSADMHWLTHELTHVSQYEHVGSQYLGEAVHAQAGSAKYDYNGQSSPMWRPAKNPFPKTSGKHFREFNREQQADIAADYYYSLYGKTVPSGRFNPLTSDYEPVIDELRAGDM